MTTRIDSPHRRTLVHRWPSALGLALAAHAAWDLVHYRRNQVVPRSLAEFCMLLDIPLGAGALILAVVG